MAFHIDRHGSIDVDHYIIAEDEDDITKFYFIFYAYPEFYELMT